MDAKPPSILYSVIVVTHNNLRFTVDCMETLLGSFPERSEIIVVDNASNDGTRGYLLDLAKQHDALALLFLDENFGWCIAGNQGLARAKGDYLVLLNNDCMLAPGWLEGLRSCMDHSAEQHLDFGPVGLVGPVSNNVGGDQAINGPQRPSREEMFQFADMIHHQQAKQWQRAWFLSGFCMMISRACYEDIGPMDERFSPGGFDDNDWVLRAQAAGWTCVIAGDVYVHHEGGATFKLAHPDQQLGLKNRAIFSAKWREKRRGPQRLVAAYRVKNARATIEASLEATARFADHIVVLDDGSTDGTSDILKNHPAVSTYEFQDLPFDERRDRNHILRMAAAYHPDWVISIDADEIFEMDRDRAQQLMHLNDPHIKALGFHWYTFWEPEHQWFRADGIFGRMSGYRMYKWEPNQKITAGTAEGLHCGNIPSFSQGAYRFTNIRVRHLGYDHETLRRTKYDFYRERDKQPDAALVGNTNYHHLISSTVSLRRYPKRHGLSLCMIVKNEAERLEGFLNSWQPFVDEICIVDTGSTDETVDIASCFTHKVEHFSMRSMQLDEARNRAIAMSQMPWILALDPDEFIDPGMLPQLQRLLDESQVHAYSFEVANHQKEGNPVATLAIRLFRNQPDIFYSRPVHETLEQSLEAIPDLIVRPSGIPLHHYGFLKDDQRIQEKVDAYFECNRTYRETHPEDPMPWYNEALHLLNEGHTQQAGHYFEKAISLNQDFLSPYAQLAFIHQERAIHLWGNLVRRAQQDHPIRPQAINTLNALSELTPPRPFVGKARETALGLQSPETYAVEE